MPVNFRGAEGVSLINSPINDILGDNNIQNVFPDVVDHSKSEPKTETEDSVRDVPNDETNREGTNPKPEADTANTYSLPGHSGSTSTAPRSGLFQKLNQRKSKQSRSQNSARQPAK